MLTNPLYLFKDFPFIAGIRKVVCLFGGDSHENKWTVCG